MSEYGIGSMSGDVRVPKSQKAAAIKDADDKIKEAAGRLKRSRDYTERRRAEDDLAGAQAARQKYAAWREDD